MRFRSAQWLTIFSVIGLGLAFWVLPRESAGLKPIDELRVRFTGQTKIPDPAHIASTGDWYYLDHISGGLSFYDSHKKTFRPLYAESWVNESDGSHRFRIRPGIKFHDGTPITTKDILWTLKRQLLLKTSTHFPLWEYVMGCENIRTLEDECDGLKATSDHEIVIKLKSMADSFFLQISSPETGIWSAADMDPKTAALKPTKFSGPYFVSSVDEKSALLARNENSPISRQFPHSPKAIRIKAVPLTQIDDALMHRDIDVAVRLHAGISDKNWKEGGIETRATTVSGIILFFALGQNKAHPAIGRDFINAAWKANQDPTLTAAETFIPFAANYGLKKSELLHELPEHTAKKLRVFCPIGYYSKALLDQLQGAAEGVGSEIEFIFAPSPEWFASIEDPKAGEKYDYLLTIYAASERYPAVQLRYLTGKFSDPKIDLKRAESPDLSADQIKILRDYQKWLLSSRQSIPIYFTVTEFLHQKNIDIGEQPDSDAEIELWRVQEKVR